MGYEGARQEKDHHFGRVEFESPVRKVQLPELFYTVCLGVTHRSSNVCHRSGRLATAYL